MPGDRNRFTKQWDAVDPFDPDYPHLWIKVEHLGRYLFARNYLESRKCKVIADVGCGTGYGSAILASVASTVFAVDENKGAIDGLRQRNTPSVTPVELELGVDRLESVIEPESLDAVVCFETLEHLHDPFEELQHLFACLRPGGVLLLSVPNSASERVDDQGLLTNPFHQRAFSISSINRLLHNAGFQTLAVLGQPLAAEIHANETRLIRRKQMSGRIGDHPALHDPETLERLALTAGCLEQRDIERSYSIIMIAEKSVNED